MKDKKKIFIITGAVLLLLVLITTCILLKKKPTKIEEITITFNVDGGTTVDNMKIKKGTEIKLPKTVKDGYNFMGWYIDEEKLEDKITINEDKTITAKWEKIPEDAKTFTVTFNSNGGTNVEKLTVECDKELTLPASPTKQGYEFISWVDQHETPILDQALLTCEDITLYANWEKVEEKKEEKQKTYTCPDGYQLEGTKCTQTKNATKYCPDGTREDGDNCVTLTDYNQGTRTCPKVYIEGHEYNGTKLDAGTTFCLYAVYESIKDEATCEATPNGLPNNGHYAWSGGKCYKARLQNYETSCGSGYTYYSSADILNKFGGHNNGGCYKTTTKSSKCDAGFTLSSDKCTKTIDATLK